jgi:hypothetical protein
MSKNNKRNGQTQHHKFVFSFGIYIRVPNNADMAWDRYITPFNNGLWLAVAIAACVLCVSLALTNFSNKGNQSLSLIATVFYSPSCLCQQGKKANHLCALFTLFYVSYCNPILSFALSSGIFLFSPLITLDLQAFH